LPERLGANRRAGVFAAEAYLIGKVDADFNANGMSGSGAPGSRRALTTGGGT